MKKALSIVLLLTVMFFGLSSCGDDEGGDQTVTYSGRDGNTEYTLKITAASARYVAQTGDNYELTSGRNRSTGTVNVSGNTIILTPANGTGTVMVTVSDGGIVSISGSGFNWDRGGAFDPPGTVTPSGSSGGGSGDGGGGSGLNGNWYDDRGGIMVLNNGSFTQKSDNVDVARGRYTTSGNRFTLTITQMNGAIFEGSIPGISPNQWYTEDQLRQALIDSFRGQFSGDGLSDAMITRLVDDTIKGSFGPHEATYTLNGNTLTINWEVNTQSYFASGTTVYTRNGAGGSSGGSGDGGGNTNGQNYPPAATLSEYGLSGLTPITGATRVSWYTMKQSGVDYLGIVFTGSTTTDNYVTGWFSNNGWTQMMMSNDGDGIMYYYNKTGFTAIYTRDTDDNDCTVVSYKGGIAGLY